MTSRMIINICIFLLRVTFNHTVEQFFTQNFYKNLMIFIGCGQIKTNYLYINLNLMKFYKINRNNSGFWYQNIF